MVRPAQQRYTSAIRGVGGVKAEGAVVDEADLGVEAFEAAVGEPEADGGEDAVAVRS